MANPEPYASLALPSPLANMPPPRLPCRAVLLSVYWLLQGALAYVLAGAWITLNANSGGSAGPLYSFDFSDLFHLLTDPHWAPWAAGGILVFTLLQGFFLLPVRRPAARLDGRGVPLWLSAAAAGVAVALLWGAVATSGFALVQLWQWEHRGSIEQPLLLVILGSVGVGWLIATPLIVRFMARRRRETALSRIAAAVFMGTTVEAVAIMPLDVMMRRKTDCYCDTGTFWALSACGTVGLFVFGPAVLLPIVARRRKRWYASRCDACGYDMSATLGALRCPECGAGWRSEPAAHEKAPVA